MPARAFPHVYEVQSGFDVSRKLALEKIQDDATGGGGLHILFADGGRRIDGDDIHAVAASLHRNLLTHELRPLIVTDHIRQRNRRILVSILTVAGEPDGRNARRVNNTPDAILPCSFKKRSRSFDVRAIHFVWILDPEAVIGCNVKYRIAA